MITLFSILIIFGVCISLEFYVKSIIVRITGVLVLVIVAAGIAINVGIHLGKVEQLNRFSRLLPRVFETLDEHRLQPETLARAIVLLRGVANDPFKLDHIEATIEELEKLQPQK